MKVLFTDETNLEATKDVKFFVYGGLFFPLSVLPDLHREMGSIRRKCGFHPCDTLKFTQNNRPAHINKETYTAAKDEVLRLCEQMECRFLSFVIHHGIVKNRSATEKKQQGANVVFGRFHTLLREANEHGICVIDNIPERDQYMYLREKATRGLVLSSGDVPLEQIPLFAATCVDASHAASATDIVLGAFRYAINHDRSSTVACELLGKVLPLIPHEELPDGGWKITEVGLMLRPKERRLATDYRTFKPDYDDLMQRINDMLRSRAAGGKSTDGD